MYYLVTFDDGSWMKVYGCKSEEEVKAYIVRNFTQRPVKNIERKEK